MILSGVRGNLVKVDKNDGTLTIKKQNGEHEYPIEDKMNAYKFENMVGKEVNIRLYDYYVVELELA